MTDTIKAKWKRANKQTMVDKYDKKLKIEQKQRTVRICIDQSILPL